MDYGYFHREAISPSGGWTNIREFDLFLSPFNLSERVKHVYASVRAKQKVWLIHQEYGIPTSDLPPEERFEGQYADESSYCVALYDFISAKFPDLPSKSIGIDATGMLRPHLLFLIKLLKTRGITRFDIFYAEPDAYKKREHTTFSAGAIYEVRPVHGYEGTPATSSTDDFLIVGMGFDDRMIAEVADDRAKADKHQLFGLPSLSADMYQQGVLRSRKAAEELSDPNFSENSRSFAPANDPFGTAAVLSEIIRERRRVKGITNLYLSPLGTKPQVIGFALYHNFECQSGDASIIFPFSHGYSPETGDGVARIWRYHVEF